MSPATRREKSTMDSCHYIISHTVAAMSRKKPSQRKLSLPSAPAAGHAKTSGKPRLSLLRVTSPAMPPCVIAETKSESRKPTPTGRRRSPTRDSIRNIDRNRKILAAKCLGRLRHGEGVGRMVQRRPSRRSRRRHGRQNASRRPVRRIPGGASCRAPIAAPYPARSGRRQNESAIDSNLVIPAPRPAAVVKTSGLPGAIAALGFGTAWGNHGFRTQFYKHMKLP